VRRAIGSARQPSGGRLLAVALAEAEQARHGYVGCEHLLLALLREPTGTVADVLRSQGLDLESARAAVRAVVEAGRGDGPRWNQADLLAMLGVDLPAIRRRVNEEFGPYAIEALYRSRAGRRLPRGPLCGLAVSPLLKKSLELCGTRAKRIRGCPAEHERVLLGMLDADSSGLNAVLDALGTSTAQLRAALLDRQSHAH
jgi:ATP-dependent Clp protease ATP-binding subunit ClpA